MFKINLISVYVQIHAVAKGLNQVALKNTGTEEKERSVQTCESGSAYRRHFRKLNTSMIKEALRWKH